MLSTMSGLLADVKKIILREELIKDGDLIVVAVSGGADSLSLLHILNRLQQERFLCFSLHIAHLNHRMRGISARKDAEFVRSLAKKMGLPYTIGEVDVKAFQKRWRLSPEDAARRLRYKFLTQLAKRTGSSSIAMGHTRDDQVETMLLNFLRGTGLDGLAGIKFKRAIGEEELFLIRPLLETSKKELSLYCRENGLVPRFDETNLDTRFLRNKIRRELLPYLEKEFNPALRQALLRLSRLFSLDSDLLQSITLKSFPGIIAREKNGCLELDAAKLLREHEALQGRILRLAISRLCSAVPRNVGYNHISSILKLAKEGPPHGMLYLPRGIKVARNYDKLIIFGKDRAQPASLRPFYLPVPGKKSFPGKEMALEAEIVFPQQLKWPPDPQREAYFDYQRVRELLGVGDRDKAADYPAKLLVRLRRNGDRFHPLGAPGKRKLKKYFIDQKIPFEERGQIPLVLAGEEIIWVLGKQISHHCRVTEKTERVLVLRLV